MRAAEFIEDVFGTKPKRTGRPGSRPSRGHEPVPRYRNSNEDKEEKCPHCGGTLLPEELLSEKKDSCYYKVKSRYKVWPSAYASGALVQCRKKGAKNWGSKS